VHLAFRQQSHELTCRKRHRREARGAEAESLQSTPKQGYHVNTRMPHPALVGSYSSVPAPARAAWAPIESEGRHCTCEHAHTCARTHTRAYTHTANCPGKQSRTCSSQGSMGCAPSPPSSSFSDPKATATTPLSQSSKEPSCKVGWGSRVCIQRIWVE